MENSMVQEVTTTSWFGRIKNALIGVFVGIILIIAALFLVFWNEGNALHTAQSLEQTESVLISVANAPIDSKNDMRVVYISGLATTENVLKDKIFNISETAIQLNRKVEMYQWKEEIETKTEKQVGGSEQEVKTYTYKQVWSPDEIDSSEFKEQAGHQNPTVMPIKSKIQYAQDVNVGDFVLPADLIKQISGDKSVDLSNVNLTALKERYKKPVTLQGEGLYMGEDESTPKVGDIRVLITTVLPEIVSVIAQQSGNSLQPYMAPAGREVSLIENGKVSPTEMIHNAQSQNRIMAWMLRAVSLAMMIIGFALIMAPASVLADVIPFLGSLVSFGTTLIAFVAGISLWVIAFAIAWFTVRPLLAIGMIVITIGICYFILARRKKPTLK